MPKKKPVMVEIPPITRGAARIRIEGLSPLIMHAWSEKAKAEMRGVQEKTAKKAKTKRGPAERKAEFEAAKYKDSKGRDCLLAAAIKKAIVNAARNLDDVKMTELKQQIFVRGELIPIIYERCEMREDMVRLKNGSPDLRYRPYYINWSAEFEIEWDNKLEVNQVLHLLNVAGFSVGIHDWRPERSGEYGRFQLVAAGPTGNSEDNFEGEISGEPPSKAVKAAKEEGKAETKTGPKAVPTPRRRRAA